MYPKIYDFYPDLNDKIINDISRYKIKYIIIPKTQTIEYQKLQKAQKYVKNNYKLLLQTKEGSIYKL